MPRLAVVGLGANLGDAAGTVRAAIEALAALSEPPAALRSIEAAFRVTVWAEVLFSEPRLVKMMFGASSTMLCARLTAVSMMIARGALTCSGPLVGRA